MKERILFVIEDYELGGITVFQLIRRIKKILEDES